MKDLYTESYKSMMKKNEETQINENIPMFMDGSIHIFKLSILSKVTYRFNAIPFKISMAFFKEIKKAVLEFMWNHKDSK